MTDARWITEREAAALLDLPGAIEALRVGLPEEATGEGATMVKTHASWGEHATLHALGGTLPGRGVVGTKTWAHTPGGACPLLLLFDATDGSLRAVIEAFALGQLRTASVSGLATDLLAAPDADVLAIAGTGKQALPQVAAVCAVRPITQVRVWDLTREAAEAFASRIRDTLGVDALATDTPAELVAGARVITTATRATSPFLAAEMPEPGTHLNAIGAITPERIEIDPKLLARAHVVATDSVDQARNLSQELQTHFGDSDTTWSALQPLSALIATGTRRPEHADLTVFKAMGIGLADVALGARVLEAAQATKTGRSLPQPTRVTPQLLPVPTR